MRLARWCATFIFPAVAMAQGDATLIQNAKKWKKLWDEIVLKAAR